MALLTTTITDEHPFVTARDGAQRSFTQFVSIVVCPIHLLERWYVYIFDVANRDESVVGVILRCFPTNLVAFCPKALFANELIDVSILLLLTLSPLDCL